MASNAAGKRRLMHGAESLPLRVPIRATDDLAEQPRDYRQETNHQGCRQHYQDITTADSSKNHMGNNYAKTVNYNFSGPNEPTAEDKRREDFLDALAFDAMGARRSAVDPAYGDTCRWVLQTDEFVRWRDPALRHVHRGFLWVKGKAGVGKSTIMKFMFEHVENSMSEHVLLSFFFNARGTSLETSGEGLYRTLLFQLLKKLPSLWDAIEIPHSFAKGQTWSAAILQDIFRAAILHIQQQRLILVVDALDEGVQEEVRKMVRFLGGLAENTNSKGIWFDICFASRHYPSITTRYCEELVVEGQDAHTKDIRVYVSENLNIEPVSRRFLLIAEIVRKSRSVFLWVVLVVRLLNDQYDVGATHTELLETLVKIPDDLDDLLHRILVDGASDVCLLPTLQWVLVGEELNLETLYFGVQTAVGGMTTPVWDRDEIDLPAMKRFVVNSSKGLVEVISSRRLIEGSDWGVQFVHESVREHLLAGGLQFLDPGSASDPEATAHARLAEHCQEYLRLDPSKYLGVPRDPIDGMVDCVLLEENESTREKSIKTMSPYITYASYTVWKHIEVAYLGGRFRLETFQGFPRNELINISNILEPDSDSHLAVSTSIMYFLVNVGCFQIAQAAIELYQKSLHIATPGHANSDPSEISAAYNIIGQSLIVPCGGLHGSPLSAAVALGSVAFVQLLLDCGADVNIGGGDHGSALASAASVGDENVVELLLQHGAKINVDGGIRHDPLYCAAIEDHMEVLKLLLPYGVDSHRLRSCLVEAARHGAHNAVKLLLDEMSHSALDTSGDSLDFPRSCHSAMVAAVQGRDEPRVVQLLLDRGGCPGVRDLDKLLMTSATGCQKGNVGELLRSGADPNSRDNYGWPVLMLAIIGESLWGDRYFILPNSSYYRTSYRHSSRLLVGIDRSAHPRLPSTPPQTPLSFVKPSQQQYQQPTTKPATRIHPHPPNSFDTKQCQRPNTAPPNRKPREPLNHLTQTPPPTPLPLPLPHPISSHLPKPKPHANQTKMRSPYTLLTLLILALLSVSAVAWKPISDADAGICGKKNGDVVQAIGSFCQRFPYNVPGREPRLGRYSKNLKMVVRINARCKPAQSVSKEWCFKQFYNMCRNGRKNGSNAARYGGGGCQTWSILEKGHFKPS